MKRLIKMKANKYLELHHRKAERVCCEIKSETAQFQEPNSTMRTISVDVQVFF